MSSLKNLILALLISLVISSHQSDKKGKFCPTHRVKHPTNCKLFFYCVNITKPQTTHVWIPGKCQLGLVFEPVLGMCVIPEEHEPCQGENTKMTSEMVQDLIKNQQPLLAEGPNLEFETALEKTTHNQPSPQASSHYGDLFDHRFHSNSRFPSIQEYNMHNSYPPIQPTDGDKWNPSKGINEYEPEKIPPIGSAYLDPESYKIKGGTAEDLNPSYSLKHSTNFDWREKSTTRPSYVKQPQYQPYLDAYNRGNSKNYGESAYKINFQQSQYKEEKTNHENAEEETDNKHDNHKNLEIKHQFGMNEAHKNLPINQRDTLNHTKNTNSEENNKYITSSGESNKQSQTQQQAPPSAKISNEQSGVECKNRARQPHESDCTKYYTCNPKGNLTSYNCPYQTAFNAYTQKCDNKVYNDCLRQMESGTRMGMDLPPLDEIDYTPHEQTQLEEKTDTSQEIFKCEREGKFQDTTSINHYFMCSLDQGTHALTQHRLLCPQKLLFCTEKKICTYAEECYQ